MKTYKIRNNGKNRKDVIFDENRKSCSYGSVYSIGFDELKTILEKNRLSGGSVEGIRITDEGIDVFTEN